MSGYVRLPTAEESPEVPVHVGPSRATLAASGDEVVASAAHSASNPATASRPIYIQPQTVLVQGPDGQFAVAVTSTGDTKDIDEALGERRSAPEEPSSGETHHGPAFLMSPPQVYDPRNDSYEIMMHIRHLRHKKSFLFLLVVDFLYFLLLFFAATFSKSKTESAATQTIATPPLAILILNLCVDLIGFVGTYRNSIGLLTCFIVAEGISIGIYTFAEFSVLIILRLIIFLLALHVRAGMFRERLNMAAFERAQATIAQLQDQQRQAVAQMEAPAPAEPQVQRLVADETAPDSPPPMRNPPSGETLV